MPTKSEIEAELEAAQAKVAELESALQNATEGATAKITEIEGERDGAVEQLKAANAQLAESAQALEVAGGTIEQLQRDLGLERAESKAAKARLDKAEGHRRELPRSADGMANELAHALRKCGVQVSPDLQHKLRAALQSLMG